MATCNAAQLLVDGCQFEALDRYSLRAVQLQLVAEWYLLAFPGGDVSAEAVLERACASGVSGLDALSEGQIRDIKLAIICAATDGGITPDTDADVDSFLTCTSITDVTIVAAVTNLVADLKANNLWNSLDAIYPFVGAAATPHSCNLKNTSQYSITWHGGVTHNANGITGNGTTGYGDTGFIPSSAGGNYTAASASIGVYCRTTGSSGLLDAMIGCSSTGTATDIYQDLPASKVQTLGPNDSGQLLSPVVANYLGSTILSRTAIGAKALYGPDGSVTTDSTVTVSSPTVSMYVLGTNVNGSTNVGSMNLAFAFIGAGFNAGQVSTLKTIITTFQTALGRA